MATEREQDQRRSGYISIVGRPNVGKSTLMNALVGVRVSIATHKPQTTRNRIVGIVTDPERGQIAFVDTPGIHQAVGTLNRRMVQAAWDASEQTHAILFVVDQASLTQRPDEPLWGLDLDIYNGISKHDLPIVLAINKLDNLRNRPELLPALQKISQEYRFHAVVPLSARKKYNLDALKDELFQLLPESEQLYEDDAVTDRPEYFTTAELIREQVLRQIHKEVPYGVSVTVDSIAEQPHSERLIIQAVIHVERDIHKGIIIGKKGVHLRNIGAAARQEIQNFFGRPVHLDLFVRVQPRWTENEQDLRNFGLGEDEI